MDTRTEESWQTATGVFRFQSAVAAANQAFVADFIRCAHRPLSPEQAMALLDARS